MIYEGLLNSRGVCYDIAFYDWSKESPLKQTLPTISWEKVHLLKGRAEVIQHSGRKEAGVTAK